jgi:thiamine pyrophosphokinase
MEISCLPFRRGSVIEPVAMSRFVILLGGDLLRTPRVDRAVAGARVIAADGGMRHAATLGVMPELWTGDFDSVPDGLVAKWPDVPREVFPAGKDKTDGELAIDAALARGATSLLFAGAFGGARADHAFLHLVLALRLSAEGVPTALTDGAQEGQPLSIGENGFDYAPGTLFSILGFSDLAGLSVQGARWPLERVSMPLGSSRTLSNEVTENLKISLESGRAMLIAHPYPAWENSIASP